MRKSRLFAWLCALCPGAGPMYLGQMKKGALLILSFCAVLVVAIIFRLEPILFLLPVVWMYSFFDTINSVSLSPEEQRAREEKFMADLSGVLGSGSLQKLRLPGSRVWGWGLIAAGVWLLMRSLLTNVFYRLFNLFPVLWDLWYSLPTLALAVVLFWLGLRLVRGPKAAPGVYDGEGEA